MKVIDHKKLGWFLLEDEEGLYLDVNCSHSALSYDMLIKLDENEKSEFIEKGRNFINELSNEIQEHGMTKYKNRNISKKLGKKSYEAIREFR